MKQSSMIILSLSLTDWIRTSDLGISLSLIYKDDYSPPLYQLSYGECELNIQSTDTALIDHSAKLTTIIVIIT